MDKVVHFEIPVDNTAKAKEFYRKVFDWEVEDYPGMDYTIVRSGEVDKDHMMKEKGVINGGMLKRHGFMKNPIITIQVDSIENSIKKITKNGGKVLAEKSPVGDMGFTAYFQDCEGNILGLWESAKK